MASSRNFAGPKLQGTHTTVLEDGVPLLRSLETEPWVVSLRAGHIGYKGKGGKKSLTIGKTVGDVAAEKTLRLILRASGAIQELFVQVDSTQRVAEAMKRVQEVAQKKIRGIEIRMKE